MITMSKNGTERREPPIEPRPLRYSFWAGALMIRGSVSLRVLPDVFVFGGIATVVVVASHVAEQRFSMDLSVPVGPFEAAGAVLGLLLVLRTNAGYERWWEARKLWGGIVNQSRNLASIALASGPDDVAWHGRLIRWTAAFPHAMRGHLRGQRDVPEIRQLLGDAEADRIAAASHGPILIAAALDRFLREARDRGMDPMAFNQATDQRAELIDHLGGCERILKTPLARSSAIQVRRFLLLFLGTLPFALLRDFTSHWPSLPFFGIEVGSIDWLVPVFVMLMAYPLLSLDRIGMELQNPFDTRRVDHLPLNGICATIEQNLMELLEDSIRVDGVELPEGGPSTVSDDPAADKAARDGLDTLIS